MIHRILFGVAALSYVATVWFFAAGHQDGGLFFLHICALSAIGCAITYRLTRRV